MNEYVFGSLDDVEFQLTELAELWCEADAEHNWEWLSVIEGKMIELEAVRENLMQ